MKRSSGPPSQLFLTVLLVLSVVTISSCQDDPGRQLPSASDVEGLVEPDPRQLLSELGEFLKAQHDYSFEAFVTYQSLQESGQNLSFDLLQRLVVRQPDRLFWETIEDDARIKRVWFDGGEFTMLELPDNVYGRIDAPATIPEMIYHVTTEYGIIVPFSDLLASSRAPVFLRDLESSEYVGPAWVAGSWTHHLAFRNPLVDFEVWIPVKGDPVPSRLAISWKHEPGHPQFVARFREWNFSPSISDSVFRFSVPEGAESIELVPERTDAEAGSS